MDNRVRCGDLSTNLTPRPPGERDCFLTEKGSASPGLRTIHADLPVAVLVGSVKELLGLCVGQVPALLGEPLQDEPGVGQRGICVLVCVSVFVSVCVCVRGKAGGNVGDTNRNPRLSKGPI